MRLRTQFLTTLLVFAVVIAIIVTSVFLANATSIDLHNSRDVANDAETDASKLSESAINYLLYHQNLTSWQSTVSILYLKLSSLNSSNPQQQAMVSVVLVDLQEVNGTFNGAVANIKGLGQNAETMSAIESLWNNIAERINQLSIDMRQLSRWLDTEANNANQTNLVLIVTLVGLFGAYFVLIYQLVFKRTLRSIASLKQKTKQISQGNLEYPAESIQNDEIGELSSDVDSMVANLKQTMASKQELEKEITERKKAEQALMAAKSQLQEYANNLEKIIEERTRKIRESEQSYRELYESFGEAFIATDWELNVIHWNRAAERVTRTKAADALGRKVYDVLPEFMSVDVTPYFEALQKNEPARFMMNAVSRQTKKASVFEVSTYPSQQGIIIIVEDKTEEEENKRLSAIGATAGMVGHDIRNPLQAMLADVYLLKETLKNMPEMETKTEVEESLDGIEKNITYINKIVQDLQDFAKPLTAAPKDIEIGSIFNEVLVEKAIPKNIVVKRKIDPQAIRISADPDLLKRILANLINNAVQAMPNGGNLMLRTSREDNHFIIAVEDTGVGIPDEIKPKIFSPLFTTKAKGQGFGLAVVKRMTEALGGTVTFESQKGKGTKFLIQLPILKSNPPGT